MTLPIDCIETKDVILHKIKYGLRDYIDPNLLDESVTIEWDWYVNRIVVMVKNMMWAEDLKKYEFKWPRDWWQALKERWFPEWLLERYPIEYTIKIVDIKAIYPDLYKLISMPNKYEYRIRVMNEESLRINEIPGI